MDAAGRTAIFGIGSVPVIRKQEGQKAQYGLLVKSQPDRDVFMVENQKNGKLEEWPEDECLGLDQYIEKTDKKLQTAARVIVAQDKLIQEQSKLLYSPKPETCKNLDCVA